MKELIVVVTLYFPWWLLMAIMGAALLIFGTD